MNKSIARHQKGVALIIVLLIVAIVSVLATEMGTRLQLQIKRASNIKENNQAYWYAMGAEQFAQKSLSELYKSSSAVIHLEQPWNQEFTFPIEGGGIQAQLVDLQSCFNLNALGIANSGTGANTELAQRLNAFSQVMETIEPQIPSYEIDTVRESLADWLDTDSQSRSLGAEDSEYESLPFPYVAANDLMTHKSEMRLINGVNVNWLDKLLALSCVLPADSSLKINVNTVSEENAGIIAGMTGLTLSQAQSALSARGNDGFDKPAEFLNTAEIKAITLTDEQKKWFDVTTSYFILHTRAKFNDATFAMQTVFKLDSNNKVQVIRREFSGF